jgi:hypothetical protein
MHMPGYDSWLAREPDLFHEHECPDEEEIPEPTIEEEWNASRGEYETVVTFACGSKYAIRQNSDDNWEVNGPGGFYVDFQTLEQALNYLTDDEFARGA